MQPPTDATRVPSSHTIAGSTQASLQIVVCGRCRIYVAGPLNATILRASTCERHGLPEPALADGGSPILVSFGRAGSSRPALFQAGQQTVLPLQRCRLRLAAVGTRHLGEELLQ